MDINKHRYYMMQVLLAIFRHPQLSSLLAFNSDSNLNELTEKIKNILE